MQYFLLPATLIYGHIYYSKESNNILIAYNLYYGFRPDVIEDGTGLWMEIKNRKFHF